MLCGVRVRVRHRQIEFQTGKAAKYSVKHARADLEKVFSVFQIPNMPFFKCSSNNQIRNSIILVVKLLRKQNNFQIVLTGYEEHFAISK